jgi:diguanylate cyclase (GGDEF)-like protein
MKERETMPASSPTAALAPARRRTVRSLTALTAAAVTFVALHDMLGVGGHGLDSLVTNWIQSNVFLLAGGLCLLRVAWVADERWTWLALGIGILCWWPANTTFHFWVAHRDPMPFPSISDAFWLASYPAFYVAIVLAARRQLTGINVGLWLDGLLGALALAALAAAVVLQVVLGTLGGSPAAVATNLAYPLADIVLLGLLGGIFVLSGWRPGRRWLVIAAGMALLFAADSIYLFEVATGVYHVGRGVDAIWPAALFWPAVAAWQPAERRQRVTGDGDRVLAIPSFFLLVAATVLIADHFRRVNLLAIALAGATIVVVMLRTVLTLHQVRALAESRRLAETDDLTNLPNRRHFFRRLDDRLRSAAGTESTVTLLLIDLDRFKELNDTLGHHVGDRLLREIGSRLHSGLDRVETVARLGGDEFAILLDDGTSARAAGRIATCIRAVLAAPIALDDMTLHIDASIGIATYPEHAESGVALLQRADVAMYEAKASRTGHRIYAAERDRNSRARLALVGELRSGIERGELLLHFQPKAGLASGEIVGVEGLARWQHPTRGLLAPAEFLPIAEQTGLMRMLTLRVLDLALEQCKAWRAAGLELTVGVNLSAENLLDLELENDIARLLARWEADPLWLQLEITEDVLMADPARAREVLTRLRRLGITVALDDFGTGYSSLAYIKQLELDELKIDRSFVTNLIHDSADAAIVSSTIALARSLQLLVVAEGVEDAATWSRLAELGCHYAQGYHLSRPLPADELVAWLRYRPTPEAGSESAAA